MILMLFIGLGLMLYYSMSKDKKNRTLEYDKLYYNYDIDIEKVNSDLDIFIGLILADYILLNPKLIDVQYIKGEVETEICKDVSKLVVDRMSDILYFKINTVYANAGDIISEKVYIHVMNYAISVNYVKK